MTNAQIEQIKEKIKRLGYEYEQFGLFYEIKIPAGKGYRYVAFDTLEKLSDYLDRESEERPEEQKKEREEQTTAKLCPNCQLAYMRKGAGWFCPNCYHWESEVKPDD